MVKRFDIIGEWYLPSNTEYRVHGKLSFDPVHGAELELYGSLSSDAHFPDLADQEIILGLSSESELVTLSNCAMTHSGGAKLVSGQESGKPITKYSIIFTLVGIHAEKNEDLVFDTISSEIFNLGEWVGISGFKYGRPTPEQQAEKKLVVEYQIPEPVEFKIDNHTKGKLNFIVNQSNWSRYQKQVEINQRVEFQAKSDINKSIRVLLEHLFGFQNFIILALYKSTFPYRVTLQGENFQVDYGDNVKRKTKVKLFFSIFNYQEDEKPDFDFNMIFDYRRIQHEFPTLIENWFSKYELLQPAFDLLIEQFHRRNQFNVNTFLNLAQSAETFHSRVNNHPRIPIPKYKEMREEILALTPSKYHSWLKDQFNFGNNLNLHARLSEIVDKYSNETLDVIIGDKEQFIKHVKNSRNYYTHYSTDSKKKALTGTELFLLSEKLKIQLVCAFLVEIGFTNENLSHSLDNVKWRLFNHLANWRQLEE